MTAARERPSFDDEALLLAAIVSLRGDCTRRQVGAVIYGADHRLIISGHNGGPPGGLSCLAGQCPRGRHRLVIRETPECMCGKAWPCPEFAAPYSSYDTGPGSCIALHAEQNALLYADPARLPGATLYVTCEPCEGCARMIAGTPITRTVSGPPSRHVLLLAAELLSSLAGGADGIGAALQAIATGDLS